jgi:hypothetical protein
MVGQNVDVGQDGPLTPAHYIDVSVTKKRRQGNISIRSFVIPDRLTIAAYQGEGLRRCTHKCDAIGTNEMR